MTTPNKGLNLPTVGINGTPDWGTQLNTNFSEIDLALGGKYAAVFTANNQTISLLDVTVPATPVLNYQNLIIVCSGSFTGCILTVPSSVGGEWIIVNNTSGNLVFKTTAGGTPATLTVPTASQIIAFSDGTNTYTADDSAFHYNSGTGLFEGFNGTAWVPVTGGATGGGNDQIFFQNGQAVTTSYSIPSGKNAMSAGPITVNSGITVTTPSGSVWTIV